MNTFITNCKVCSNQVIYYCIIDLLPEFGSIQEMFDESCKNDNLDRSKKIEMRVVHCSCEGNNEGIKHLAAYLFPNEFKIFNS